LRQKGTNDALARFNGRSRRGGDRNQLGKMERANWSGKNQTLYGLMKKKKNTLKGGGCAKEEANWGTGLFPGRGPTPEKTQGEAWPKCEEKGVFQGRSY